MPTAHVNGTDLYYELRGSGEPLLLIQGMSGTHASWGEPFLAALEAAGFETLRYDHRGIGRSAPWREPFSLRDLAEDAIALLEAVGWDRPHVMGISMGGMIAQEFALAHPERLATLTLGCTYAGGPDSSLTDPADLQVLSEAMMSGDRERALRQGYELNVAPAFAADQGNYAAFHAMAVSVSSPLPVIMLQMQAIGSHDTSTRLAELRTPTLVVHGTHDRMLPVSNASAIATALPDATLELLEGVGHVFWWERPQQSADLLAAHALGAAAS